MKMIRTQLRQRIRDDSILLIIMIHLIYRSTHEDNHDNVGTHKDE